MISKIKIKYSIEFCNLRIFNDVLKKVLRFFPGSIQMLSIAVLPQKVYGAKNMSFAAAFKL